MTMSPDRVQELTIAGFDQTLALGPIFGPTREQRAVIMAWRQLLVADPSLSERAAKLVGPYQSEGAAPGYHRHKCSYCGFVYEHHDCNDAGHNAVPGAHECPACHRCGWGMGIYEGDESPRVRNGARQKE